MGSPPLDRSKDLLYLLNQIADLAIGNEAPADVGIVDLSTLPEMLSYITIHPCNLKALVTTEAKLKELGDKVHKLQDMVYIMRKKQSLKRGNNQIII